MQTRHLFKIRPINFSSHIAIVNQTLLVWYPIL